MSPLFIGIYHTIPNTIYIAPLCRNRVLYRYGIYSTFHKESHAYSFRTFRVQLFEDWQTIKCFSGQRDTPVLPLGWPRSIPKGVAYNQQPLFCMLTKFSVGLTYVVICSSANRRRTIFIWYLRTGRISLSIIAGSARRDQMDRKFTRMPCVNAIIAWLSLTWHLWLTNRL